MVATITNPGHIRSTLPVPKVTTASALASLLLLASPHATAAEWKFTPRVGLTEIYSDNVRLTPAGTERSEFITQVTPGLTITGDGPRLQVRANYEMQNFAYGRQGNFSSNHQFSGVADAELVDQLFFLNGQASVSQQPISPFDTQAFSNANQIGNRTDVRTYSVSPYLRHRLGSAAVAEMRYSHDSTTSNAGGLLDSNSDSIRLSVDSGTAFRTVGWGWRYSRQDTDYDNANSLRTEETAASLRYLLTSRFALTSSVGYEKSNYLSLGTKPQGSFWQAGVSWAPTSRTNLEASGGHRYYGQSYSLSARHRTRRTVWSLGFSDQVSTTQTQFQMPVTPETQGFITQLEQTPGLDPQVLADLTALLKTPINSLTNRVFLEKRWQGSVALNGAKNTLLLSVFDTNRNALTASTIDSALLGTANVALQDNTHQRGIGAIWNWHPTSRSSLSLGANQSRAESFSTGLVTDTRTWQVALTRRYHPKLKGTLEFRRLQQEFNQPGRDVRENAVTASLLMTF
ncbi:TIGR03016 family PEP-CTERM system-associated outer membrane protein [Janthinobacterium sp. 17J80-10]|uniref:TIGR03016 family PEP-CTERM system-associated outer membrane protein n=1 Tax=Janthinobacterium sp. 17J80-10 TaxID=2497863 RepID=UPI001005621C|nr:TIGR03016 family PEP-CTERM system-associated outer membrane protein [Janthinobacterium sp. 17J80-10]QAU35392.1 TIGR03016 family PEP-CTERM system-associated outer membrane protein [Janthinobacterium sp. 17J80-10]